jgi:uncharacterized protein (TIGR03437 family)
MSVTFFDRGSLTGMRQTLLVSLLLAAPAVLLAESAMPSIGYTGAPTDHNGQNCSVCHTTYGAANSDASGSVTADITSYNPGVQQTIHLKVAHPQAQRWGFQITIRSVSDQTQSAGDYSAGIAVQVVCDNGSRFGSAPPCNAMREFAEHMNAPPTATGAGYEFDVVWSPPESEIGDLQVYISAVAADGDGTPAGDRVYTLTRIISSAGGCSITKKPTLTTAVNAGSFQSAFSSKAMIAIKGLGFQEASRYRTVGLGDISNNAFPTVLSCVSVQVTGPGVPQPVLLPISYVQTDQINAQMPTFTGTGPVLLTVIINPSKPNELRSDVATLNGLQAFAPAFFLFGTSSSIATLLADTSTIIANPSVVPSARPAHPGEIVSLFGTGFGDTSPSVPAGQLDAGIARLTNSITVMIGSVTLSSSDVLYAGLTPQSISGLYQFNVRVPASTPAGDIPVIITIGGFQTQAGATIPVQLLPTP